MTPAPSPRDVSHPAATGPSASSSRAGRSLGQRLGVAVGVLVGTALVLFGLWAALEFPRLATERVQAAASEGSELVVTISHGACSDVHEVEVREGPDEVTIRAYVSERGMLCTADAIFEQVTVRLDAPLGDRTVRDGNFPDHEVTTDGGWPLTPSSDG